MGCWQKRVMAREGPFIAKDHSQSGGKNVVEQSRAKSVILSKRERATRLACQARVLLRNEIN